MRLLEIVTESDLFEALDDGGNLCFDGDIDIKVYIREWHKTSDIKSSGSITFRQGVRTSGDITAGGNIYGNGNIAAGGYIRSGGCLNSAGEINSDKGIHSVSEITSGKDIYSGRHICGYNIYSSGGISARGCIRSSVDIRSRCSIYSSWHIYSGKDIIAGVEIYSSGNTVSEGDVYSQGSFRCFGDCVVGGVFFWNNQYMPDTRGMFFHRAVLPTEIARKHWSERLNMLLVGCYDDIIAQVLPELPRLLRSRKWSSTERWMLSSLKLIDAPVPDWAQRVTNSLSKEE